MRIFIPVAVFVWIVSAFWFLITFDFTPDDSALARVAQVIFVVGIVAGVLGVIYVAVSSIRSGRREKQQWE